MIMRRLPAVLLALVLCAACVTGVIAAEKMRFRQVPAESVDALEHDHACLLYTSPSPRDRG